MTGIVQRFATGLTRDSVQEEATEPETEHDHGPYNYRQFQFWPARDGIHRSVSAGDEVVNATLYTLEGEPVELSTLWTDGPVVVEFGSITCPIFAMKTDAMDDLASQYEDRIKFYVVYTREAHPGQRYHRHTSLAQKRRHARDAKREEEIDREVLVDDVDGSMHRAYDSLPNAVYVIGQDGVVAHRADWLDTELLAEQLEALVAADGRGAGVSPTNVTENYHKPSGGLLKTTARVQRRAGAGSLRDFAAAVPEMARYRLRRALVTRFRP